MNIHVSNVVKEFSDVFQDTEIFREQVVYCQMAIAKHDQPEIANRYMKMKETFTRLSKEMRELDVQIKRFGS